MNDQYHSKKSTIAYNYKYYYKNRMGLSFPRQICYQLKQQAKEIKIICVFCRREDPSQKYKKSSKKKSQAPPARRLPRMQCEGSCKFQEGSEALSQPANKARGELEYTSFIIFMIVTELTRHALSFTAILNTKKKKRIMTIACAHQASQMLFY